MYLAQSTNWGHFPDRIGIYGCWFLRRGENRSTRRKTSRSKDENQQQTQPTYDAESGNRTRATLVRGERSHHCAIPAPLTRHLNGQGRYRWQTTVKWVIVLIRACFQLFGVRNLSLEIGMVMQTNRHYENCFENFR